MATITQATLNLYVYQGTLGERPATPQYTLTKSLLSGESIIVFEIAELVKDYVDISFTGDYDNIVQTAWVEAEITRSFDNSTQDTINKKLIAFKGYGEFQDGINPQLSNGFLLSNDTIFLKKGEAPFIPFYSSSNTDSIHKVKYFNEAIEVNTDVINTNVSDVRVDSTEFRASTTNIRADITQRRSFQSSKFSKHSQLPQNITKVQITLVDGSVREKSIRLIEECKHRPYKISFINKFGVIQDLWFFKRRDDSFETERDDYKHSILNIDTSTTYSSFEHSRRAIDIRAKKKIKLNTGFVTEDHNEVIKQLMVSEECWLHDTVTFADDTDSTNTLIPIVPSTSSFNEKKEVNEKLINFTVEFDIANNFIQDIR
tara:strand:+ start:1061 stop:2176 length:1116 start_codon:yes stop_codon:yes gene_type:complete